MSSSSFPDPATVWHHLQQMAVDRDYDVYPRTYNEHAASLGLKGNPWASPEHRVMFLGLEPVPGRNSWVPVVVRWVPPDEPGVRIDILRETIQYLAWPKERDRVDETDELIVPNELRVWFVAKEIGKQPAKMKRFYHQFDKALRFHFEFFTYSEMSNYLFASSFVPKQCVVAKQEEKALLTRLCVEKKNLPQMHTSDIVARYFNCKPGQIVCALDHSETRGHLSYRVVRGGAAVK